jgi:type I restriction enzyme R subunit
MAARKMLTNASYFAFTATPKNKTLEMFGIALPPDAEGKVKHRPFHSYTMKQAIEEGFILDVLKATRQSTATTSWSRRPRTTRSSTPRKPPRSCAEVCGEPRPRDPLKAEIMVDHFHEQVLATERSVDRRGRWWSRAASSGPSSTSTPSRRISWSARARTRPSSRSRASTTTAAQGSARHSLNGFSSGDIADKIPEDPYRFLICADKFQTGYDEPLLHTMYVDKPLSGIKAVQTLSRLNRAHPQKHDCFVLDFQNNSEAITFAFQDYYRTTLLAEETDPNKLHDLKAALDAAQVYSPEQMQQVVELFLGGADRDKLDPILDACVAVYKPGSTRTARWTSRARPRCSAAPTSFLSSVIPYSNAEWEKLSILLNLLIPKLPAPKEEDLAKGILEAIDMDSYRVEKKAAMKIALADKDAEIEPVPTDAAATSPSPSSTA